MQRAAVISARKLLIGAARLRQGQFFGDRDERVEPGLLLVNAAQRFLRKFYG